MSKNNVPIKENTNTSMTNTTFRIWRKLKFDNFQGIQSAKI